MKRVGIVFVNISVAAVACAFSAGSTYEAPGHSSPACVEAVVAGVEDPAAARFVRDTLARNPELARLEAAARAASERAPQVGSLPDPRVTVTAFVVPVETRVGPQQVAVQLSQEFPWFGKLSLAEEAAVADAAAAWARVEAERLRVVTEARRLIHEVAFIDAHREVLEADRAALARFEELARARYAAGAGLQRAVVKIQAEITRDDRRLLELEERRASLTARLNALRDRPATTPVGRFDLPDVGSSELVESVLVVQAVERRPEVAAAAARVAAAQTRIRLAEKAYRPDVTAGLGYTLVGERDDEAARIRAPEDDGRDALALFAGVNLPIRRDRLDAGVEQAVQERLAAREARRAIEAGIRRDVGDVAARLPLIEERIRLFREVLLVQAEQALASAEGGYGAGTAGVLDLLDSERVLLDIRVALERARADHAIALAALEGAVGAPRSDWRPQ